MFDTSVRERALKQRREQLEQERLKLVDAVSKVLVENREKYGIRSAYIVGSLAQPQRWYPFSDIDVAVSGCSKHILSIMKDLESATGKQVDVIELEEASFPLKGKGIVVYG